MGSSDALLIEAPDAFATTALLVEEAAMRAGLRGLIAHADPESAPPLPDFSGPDDPRIPVAVVLGLRVRNPVALGRLLHSSLPNVPIWFLADAARSKALRSALGSTPLLGDEWDTVAPRHEDLVERFARARESREREHTLLAIHAAINRTREEGGRARQQLSSAMLASEHRLALVLEHAHEAIVATDAQGRILAWNAATELLFGFEGPDRRGQALGSLLGSEGGAQLEAALESALDGRTTREVVIPVGPERERELEITVSPLLDDAGRIDGASVVARDVTARRTAERARSAAEEQLRIALEGEQSARSEAERASRTKDEFLSVLSHELRTPLHTIMLSLDVLEEAAVGDGAARAALSIIRRSTMLQTRLVQDLLDMTRILAGRLRIERRPLRVRPLVSQALLAARASAREKGVVLHSKMTGRLGRISGDPDRLAQVLGNLLANAVKFSPPGSRVEIDARRETDTIAISVRDRGEGIPCELIDHVFERFWTADSSNTRRHGGLGLGLAISKHIVEEHRGTISAESEGLDRGATFTVRLPAA